MNITYITINTDNAIYTLDAATGQFLKMDVPEVAAVPVVESTTDNTPASIEGTSNGSAAETTITEGGSTAA